MSWYFKQFQLLQFSIGTKAYNKIDAYIVSRDTPYRVLVFNCTGERDPKALLLPLLDCEFQLVIFCPNSVTTSIDPSSGL
jgi:hypothetical protein